MDAPAEQSSAPAASPGRRRVGPLRLSPQACLALALLVLGLSTYVAMTQSLHPDAYRQSSLLSSDWWLYPFEWNPHARLPAIGRDLKDVYAVPNTSTVYAVGELGTVLVSTDDGETWQPASSRTPLPTPSPTATPTPPLLDTPATNSNGTTQSLLNYPDLVPTASAAELHPDAAPEPNPRGLTDRQQGPPPSPTATPGLIPTPTATPAPQQTPRPSPPNRTPTPYATRPTPSPTPGLANSPRVAAVEDYPRPSVEGKTLAAVHFYNERDGFVVTDTDECLKTTDGTRSWSACGLDARLLTFILTGIAPPDAPGFLYQRASKTWLAWSVRPERGGLVKVKLRGEYTNVVASLSRIREAIDSGRLPFPALEEVFLIDGELGWAVAEGNLFRTFDGGQTWEPYQTNVVPENNLHGLFCNPAHCWAVGERGEVVEVGSGAVVEPGGQVTASGWFADRKTINTKQGLKAITFRHESPRGWAVGDAGTILHTEDYGRTWVHQTQEQGRGADGRLESAGGVYYFRLLPPWYYVSWVVVALLLLPVRRTAVVDLGEEPEPSVADVLVSDRPLEEGDADTIDFKPIALGLSRFLRNENTKPPLTIAVTGEWGTGKSSLMNLLRADLRRYDFRPVWFNAWHHQKEEHLLASLLQYVRLQAVPPFWRPEGLVFRARLLRIRGARHWGPVLALVLVALVAVFYELIRNSTGATNTYPEQVFKEIASLFYGEHKPEVGEFTKFYLSRLPLLVSLLTVAGTVWRGAKAFGVNPASLMASMSRGVRVRDLDAQTSFRQRFASEFNDVTKALGARQMIVFIDDLDRCRPENVVETLEAVNFLVTSGECFVVIGMARERVEPCVGLSFKDVAAEMLEESGTEGAPPSGDDKDEPKRLQEAKARQKRLEYARQYLDKLINIEVPVPVPTPAQSRGILLANARRAEEERADRPKPSWWRRLPGGAAALARDYGRLLLWCAGLVALLSFSYGVASFLARPLALSEATPRPSPSPAASPTPASTPTPAPTPRGNATPTPVQTSTPQPSSTPLNVNTPELTPGKRSVLLAAVPVLVVVLAVVWVGFWVLTRRPGLVVKDSPRFVEALTIWHPLVFARSSTPRSVKRFMNRVRYLAMRQRRQKDDPPAWKRLLRRFSSTETSSADAEKEKRGNGAAPIPDELLVALAAIQHFRPRWLNLTPLLWTAQLHEARQFGLNIAEVEESDWKLFQEVKRAHAEKFGLWDESRIMAARNEFLKISAGVHVN